MITVMDMGIRYGYPCAQLLRPEETTLKEFDDNKSLAENLAGVNLVIFGGGEDINPSIYGHKNVGSYCGGSADHLSHRDQLEVQLAQKIQGMPPHVKPRMLGICRGAQLLCALTGGWLVQHVDGHAGRDHWIHSPYGRRKVNSYHHQMMVPQEFANLIAFSDAPEGAEYIYDVDGSRFGRGLFLQRNAEVVLFDDFTLGIQSHPEYFGVNHEQSKFARQLIRDYLNLGVTP